jgi:hypothetical protein
LGHGGIGALFKLKKEGPLVLLVHCTFKIAKVILLFLRIVPNFGTLDFQENP